MRPMADSAKLRGRAMASQPSFGTPRSARKCTPESAALRDEASGRSAARCASCGCRTFASSRALTALLTSASQGKIPGRQQKLALRSNRACRARLSQDAPQNGASSLVVAYALNFGGCAALVILRRTNLCAIRRQNVVPFFANALPGGFRPLRLGRHGTEQEQQRTKQCNVPLPNQNAHCAPSIDLSQLENSFYIAIKGCIFRRGESITGIANLLGNLQRTGR